MAEKKKRIAGAIKHPGSPRKALHAKPGKPIPAKKPAAAAEKGGKIGERGRLGETLITAELIFGSHQIYRRDDAPDTLFWTSRMNVDADGSPRAYHPKGSPPGLDFRRNAGLPGNWWALVVSKGKPIVQPDDHPAPGFHVSTTALEDHGWPKTHPNHWVNSEVVPFLVLPSRPPFKAKLGDLSFCFNLENGHSSWFIYADVGPVNKIGEGSIKLNDSLGLMNPRKPLHENVKKGGTSNEIIANILFRQSAIGWPRTNEELSAAALKHFDDWGGLPALKQVFSKLDWSKFH